MIASITRVSMTTLALWENPSYECPPRRRAKRRLNNASRRFAKPAFVMAVGVFTSFRAMRAGRLRYSPISR